MIEFLIIAGPHPVERRLRRRGVRDRRRASRGDRKTGQASGNRLAKRVLAVLEDPKQQDRYIATAQLGITVASLGLGMYGEHVLADGIYGLIGGSGLPAWLVSHGFASVMAVAILTYFHIVIGEMVPKSLALQHAEAMVLWITPPMLWIRNALFPFVVALNAIGNRLLKIFGVNRQAQNADQYYTSEELQLVVQESEDRGALRAESGQMLQELFEFGGLTAGEVMVPRVRLAGIPLGTTPDQIRDLLGRTPHTRYPIYERDLDHILGMVHIKDLLRVLLRHEVIGRSHARPLPAGARDRGARYRAVHDAAGADADGDRPRRARRHCRAPSRFRTCSRKSSARSRKGRPGRHRSTAMLRAVCACRARCGSTSSDRSSIWSWSTRTWTASAAWS